MEGYLLATTLFNFTFAEMFPFTVYEKNAGMKIKLRTDGSFLVLHYLKVISRRRKHWVANLSFPTIVILVFYVLYYPDSS